MWIALSDFSWWFLGLLQVTCSLCFLYPFELFFAVSSSLWTAVMAVHLVLLHFGVQLSGYQEHMYHILVITGCLACTLPTALLSGTWTPDPGYPGLCISGNSTTGRIRESPENIPIYAWTVVAKVSATMVVCITCFFLLHLPRGPRQRMASIIAGEAVLKKADYISNARYLLVYILCWAPRLSVEILMILQQYNDYSERFDIPFALQVVERFTQPSIGFWNAMGNFFFFFCAVVLPSF